MSDFIFTILTVGIICSSLFFTNFMITDFEHEKELYNIAIDLSEKITTVNRDYEGVSYFTWVKNDPSNFPILSSETNDESKIELIRIGKGSQNDFNNLKRCIIERIKPFQDQLTRYEEIKPMPDSINLKND